MKKNIVEKSNTLNMFISNTNDDMTLNELRFFCMYLSKLNARNPDKRTAEISVDEFEKLFGVELNTTAFTAKIQKIAGRTVRITENGRVRVLTLYSEFCWSSDRTGTIRIMCNDQMLPYIFELKKNYTAYRLENISKLGSVSKIRLYELMKQYEKLGAVRFEVEELKQLVMSREKRFNDFRLRIIEPAVRDINKNTDITIKYDKVLKSRKCVAIDFFIGTKAKRQTVRQTPQNTEFVQSSCCTGITGDPFSTEQKNLFKENIRTVLKNVYTYDSTIKKRTDALFSKCLASYTLKSQTCNIKNPVHYMQGIIGNITEAEIKKPQKEVYNPYTEEYLNSIAVNRVDGMENISSEYENPYTEEYLNSIAVNRVDGMENISSEYENPFTEEFLNSIAVNRVDDTEETIQEPEDNTFGNTEYENILTVDYIGPEDFPDTRTHNEDIQENISDNYFKSSQEEFELFIKVTEIIKNMPNSTCDEITRTLDIVDKRWRHFNENLKFITDRAISSR